MSKYNTATPYIASYVLLRNDKDQIAFVLRSKTDWMNNHYGLPSGKVEQDESYIQAAIREAKEEVGVDIKPEDLKYMHTSHRKEGLYWVDVYFEAAKWEGEPYNAEPERHSELVWLDPKALPDTVIASVKFTLEQIAAGKMYSEYGWSKTKPTR